MLLFGWKLRCGFSSNVCRDSFKRMYNGRTEGSFPCCGFYNPSSSYQPWQLLILATIQNSNPTCNYGLISLILGFLWVESILHIQAPNLTGHNKTQLIAPNPFRTWHVNYQIRIWFILSMPWMNGSRLGWGYIYYPLLSTQSKPGSQLEPIATISFFAIRLKAAILKAAIFFFFFSF